MCNSSKHVADPEVHLIMNVEYVTGPIAAILTLVANLALQYYEFKNRRNAAGFSRTLVVSLSLADISTVVFGYVPVCLSYMFPYTSGVFYLHCACAFCLQCSGSFSQCVTVFIAAERYTSIGKPYFYVQYCNLTIIFGMVFTFILYATVISVPTLLNFLRHSVSYIPYVMKFSTFATPLQDFIALGHNLVLILILLYCNTCVIKTLRKMAVKIAVTCPTNRQEYEKYLELVNGSGKEFLRLTVAVSLVVFISTSPHLVRVVCRQSGTLPSPLGDFIAWRLSLATSFLNPFLHGLLRKKIRQRVRTFVKDRCRCCGQNRVAGVQLPMAESLGV